MKKAILVLAVLLTVAVCFGLPGDQASARENNALIGRWSAADNMLFMDRAPNSMNSYRFGVQTIEFFESGHFIATCTERTTATGTYYVCDKNTLILHSDYIGNQAIIFKVKSGVLAMEDYRSYYENGYSEPSAYLYHRAK